MVGKSWVHNVSKDELVKYTQEFGIESSGTLDELRRLFKSFLAKENHSSEEKTRLRQLERMHSGGEPVESDDDTLDGTQNNGEEFPPEEPILPKIQVAKPASIPIEQVRKWSVRFNGNKGVLEFIERVEELAVAYEIDLDTLPRMMPELLKDDALIWYRNNYKTWTSWQTFKEDLQSFFLPTRYFEKLEDEIRARRQRPGEKFKTYVLELQQLMRYANFSEQQRLERIFRNANTEVQRYIKRGDFDTLSKLLQLADDLEEIQSIEATTQRENQPKVTKSSTENHTPRRREELHRRVAGGKLENPKSLCKRCAKTGHNYYECRAPKVLFCWECGRQGIRTIDCCKPRQGNKQGADIQQAQSTPSQSMSCNQSTH